MSRRSKFTVEEKLAIVEQYRQRHRSQRDILREYGVDHEDLERWRRRYEAHGVAGLEDLRKNTYYPQEIRVRAVQECLEGRKSMKAIAREYEISSHSILQRWVRKYTGLGVVPSERNTGGHGMQKARRTTFEERVDIVRHCLDPAASLREAARR